MGAINRDSCRQYLKKRLGHCTLLNLSRPQASNIHLYNYTNTVLLSAQAQVSILSIFQPILIRNQRGGRG